MTKYAKTKQILARIAAFFPTKLPQGAPAFERFMEKICATYDFPNGDSYRQAVATMVLHLGPNTNRKNMRYFAQAIMKSSANQVAYHVIEEVRKAENDKRRADEESSKLQLSSDSTTENGAITEPVTSGAASS